MKDIVGYARKRDVDGGGGIMVHPERDVTDRIGGMVSAGLAVKVLVTDNSRLARLRITREMREEYIASKAWSLKGWLDREIKQEEVKDV